MSFEITSTNPVVRSIIEGTAPRPAQAAASRGILPLPQNDLLEILVFLALGDDAELKENAVGSLKEQSGEALEMAVRSTDISPNVLDYFARSEHLPIAVYEGIVTNDLTPPMTVAAVARTSSDPALLELISINQQLLIREPSIIDAILNNSHRSSEADRRANEIKREFFEKERGAAQIANELRAQGKEAAAEFVESSEFSDTIDEDDGLSAEDALIIAQHIEVLDRDTDDSWLSLEYIEEIYEETEEQRRAVFEKILGDLQEDGDEATAERLSLLNRIIKMGVKDRVKLGMKGDREARNILIRDPNKLVSSAVVNNPKITEQEIERIASIRSISADILRQLAMNRQWARIYNIQVNLAKNPRTPIANSMSIMNRLQLRELMGLSKDRNVPEAVRKHATRLINARKGGKG